MKGVKSMDIQCGVTLSEVDFLELKQCFSGLSVVRKPDVLQIGMKSSYSEVKVCH